MSADKQPYISRAAACEASWGQAAPDIVKVSYFTGKSLKTGDTHLDTSERLKALCTRALKLKDWTYLLKVDDDVAIWWKTLTFPAKGVDYSGPEVPGPGLSPFGSGYVAGAFMWLSRKAVEILAEHLDPNGTPDDKQAGEILRAHGIKPVFIKLHKIVRRPGQQEITKYDVEEFRMLGAALETGSPENMLRLYGELNKLPVLSEVRPTVWNGHDKRPQASGAVYAGNGKAEAIYTPAVSSRGRK
jgi:hypothetical protein